MVRTTPPPSSTSPSIPPTPTWKRWLRSWVVPVVAIAIGVLFVVVGVLRTSTSFNIEFASTTVKCGNAWQANSLQHGPNTHLEVVGGDNSFGNFSVDGAIDKCTDAAKSRTTTAIILWVLAGLLFIGAGVWLAWRKQVFARIRQ
jgi:hypothetical protein